MMEHHASQDDEPLYNLFWMNCKTLSKNFFKYIDEKINETTLTTVISTEGIDSMLEKLISAMIKLANDGFEESIDLYYKRIFDLITH